MTVVTTTISTTVATKLRRFEQDTRNDETDRSDPHRGQPLTKLTIATPATATPQTAGSQPRRDTTPGLPARRRPTGDGTTPIATRQLTHLEDGCPLDDSCHLSPATTVPRRQHPPSFLRPKPLSILMDPKLSTSNPSCEGVSFCPNTVGRTATSTRRSIGRAPTRTVTLLPASRGEVSRQ